MKDVSVQPESCCVFVKFKEFSKFVAVARMHVGDLHAVGWGEGP